MTKSAKKVAKSAKKSRNFWSPDNTDVSEKMVISPLKINILKNSTTNGTAEMANYITVCKYLAPNILSIITIIKNGHISFENQYLKKNSTTDGTVQMANESTVWKYLVPNILSIITTFVL